MRLFKKCSHCRSQFAATKITAAAEAAKCPKCGASLRGAQWYIDYYVGYERKREAVGTQKRFAEEVIAKRRIEIKEGKFFDRKKESVHRLKEILDDFLAYSKTNKKSYERDIGLVKQLLTYFDGSKRLEAVTPILIEQYKGKRLNADGRKPATVNRELACLKCAFNWAIKNAKASANPVRSVKLLKENNMRLRYLSQEEIGRLLNACPTTIRRIVTAALHTGMRLGEILPLKWEDIDFAQNIIILKNTKSGRMREIPINGVLRKTLNECRKNTDEVHVFCNESGVPYRSINSMFQRIIKKAGIADFRFHDLRHTAASYMVMLGIQLATVREILGHQSINMTLRYAHLSQEHKLTAMEMLGTRLDTLSTPRPPDGQNTRKEGDEKSIDISAFLSNLERSPSGLGRRFAKPLSR